MEPFVVIVLVLAAAAVAKILILPLVEAFVKIFLNVLKTAAFVAMGAFVIFIVLQAV